VLNSAAHCQSHQFQVLEKLLAQIGKSPLHTINQPPIMNVARQPRRLSSKCRTPQTPTL
jgi:hypothetical protein